MSAGASPADGRRARCEGIVPLTGRLEPWMEETLADPSLIEELFAEHGSPVNLLEPSAMGRNAAELADAAAGFGIDLRIFFARKANKALGFVDEALRLGLGVDLASERELAQTRARGADPSALVMSAAVKPAALLRLCVESGTTVVVDNADELAALRAVAAVVGREVPVAIRIAPALAPDRLPTRFGTPPEDVVELLQAGATAGDPIRLEGLHFHLDGYVADERVAGLEQALGLIDSLRDAGGSPSWIDIGGGIPMSYLDDPAEWERFRAEQLLAVSGRREPLTFEGHGLGLTAHGGEAHGKLNVYPGHQSPTRGAWLREVLGAPLADGRTVAAALNDRGLGLRCEPGRSLLDGCGMTVARVEFRKPRRDGTWLIGLAMNRTQCRSTADDFPVDPILIPAQGSGGGEAIEGYLVGAYCIERELISWRRLRFGRGVGVGDVIAIPNTGGYMMHILESASHQIPLARNLMRGEGGFGLDPIDAPGA